ncbi:MAG TPA: carboxylesterase family protein, partial [Albitalea sp.]|nr:carboxylesterase family protein [Albitalea sp.]
MSWLAMHCMEAEIIGRRPQATVAHPNFSSREHAMSNKRKAQGNRLKDATARLRAVCAGIVAATFLAACGGGSADDAGEAPPESTAQGAGAPAAALEPDTVRIRLGLVRGNSYDGGVEFLGIPFAKPPVGPLRWRPPADPQALASTLSTQVFRPACPQKRFEQGKDTYTLEGEEDCLYLNVW